MPRRLGLEDSRTCSVGPQLGGGGCSHKEHRESANTFSTRGRRSWPCRPCWRILLAELQAAGHGEPVRRTMVCHSPSGFEADGPRSPLLGLARSLPAPEDSA